MAITFETYKGTVGSSDTTIFDASTELTSGQEAIVMASRMTNKNASSEDVEVWIDDGSTESRTFDLTISPTVPLENFVPRKLKLGPADDVIANGTNGGRVDYVMTVLIRDVA